MAVSANSQTQSSYGEVLAIPSFRHLWVGQIFSQLAVNTLLFVLALRLYQTTGSNTAVSGLFLAYGIPAALFGMVAGTVVDHLDKRRVLVYCDIVRALLVLILFFLSGNIFLVYLVMFVNAVITQLYVPSEAPIIPKIVPDTHLVTANSMFSVTFYSSLAVGSVASGPLLRFLGPNWIFVIISAFFFLAAWSEAKLPSMAKGVLGFRTVLAYEFSHIAVRIWQELTDGIRYVRASRVLTDSLLLLTGTQVIFAILGTLGPGFADRMMAIDVRDASLLIVGPAVLGILIGALWVGASGYRYGSNVLIRTGITGAGITLVAISLLVWVRSMIISSSPFWAQLLLATSVFMFFLLGFANSMLDAPANSRLQEEAKGSMRGRVYGMFTAAVGGIGILPVVIGGVLADVVGVGKVIFLLGFVILVYGIYRMKYNEKSL